MGTLCEKLLAVVLYAIVLFVFYRAWNFRRGVQYGEKQEGVTTMCSLNHYRKTMFERSRKISNHIVRK